MRRRFTLLVWATLLALGIPLQPAEAKDRKSAGGRESDALSVKLAARGARPLELRQESFSGERSASRNGKPTAPLAEQQIAPSNPFHVKLGGLTLQPAVGGIKGAQLSLGF